MSTAFKDRSEAGQRLAREVQALALRDPVVLALPRGGVPIAVLIARRIHAPIDLVLVRKVGAPGSPEYAMAAVAEGADPLVEINNDAVMPGGEDLEYVRSQVALHVQENQRRRHLYLQDREPLPLGGKTVVLVDDGIATGTTVRAAIRSIRRRGARRIVLAVPVAQADEVERLRSEVDDVVCLYAPMSIGAVGLHYRHFAQVSDEEVIALLAEPAGDAGASHAQA